MNHEYPGAGCIEFRSRLEIFIEHILMWDIKKHRSKGTGVFGVVLAYGITVEDQPSTSFLHAHMIIIIDGMFLYNLFSIQFQYLWFLTPIF